MAKKSSDKPNHNITNTFYKDNTVEVEVVVNGKKVKKRCFKGDLEAVKAGLAKKAKQAAEAGKAKKGDSEELKAVKAQLKAAETEKANLEKELAESKK